VRVQGVAHIANKSNGKLHSSHGWHRSAGEWQAYGPSTGWHLCNAVESLKGLLGGNTEETGRGNALQRKAPSKGLWVAPLPGNQWYTFPPVIDVLHFCSNVQASDVDEHARTNSLMSGHAHSRSN
jgi:hypothetical protein